MALSLKVDRSTLEGHERALVDGLFFDGRTETTTELVKAHYRDEGFDPVKAIRPGLEERRRASAARRRTPRAFRIESLLLFIFGIGVLLVATVLGKSSASRCSSAGCRGASRHGNRMDRRRGLQRRARVGATGCTRVPDAGHGPGSGHSGLAVVLRRRVAISSPRRRWREIVSMALALTNTSVNALRSRQSRGAIALRKRLAAAREFFISELRKGRPALAGRVVPVGAGLRARPADRRLVREAAGVRWGGRSSLVEGYVQLDQFDQFGVSYRAVGRRRRGTIRRRGRRRVLGSRGWRTGRRRGGAEHVGRRFERQQRSSGSDSSGGGSSGGDWRVFRRGRRWRLVTAACTAGTAAGKQSGWSV